MEGIARSLKNFSSFFATKLFSIFSSSPASLYPAPPPPLPPPDLEMQEPQAAIAHNPTTNLNPNNVDPDVEKERMDIRVWLAAATPLSVFYYQARPHVPSTLHFSLFAFILAALVYFTGVFIHLKLPSIAKVMIQAGVGFAAISFCLSMGLMLL